MLPQFLAPFLWSADIKKVSPKVHKKMIVAQLLNYGTKSATDCLFDFYRKKEVKKVVQIIPQGQWDKKSLNFWSLVLGIKQKARKDYIK